MDNGNRFVGELTLVFDALPLSSIVHNLYKVGLGDEERDLYSLDCCRRFREPCISFRICQAF